jgi:hypothetical protein
VVVATALVLYSVPWKKLLAVHGSRQYYVVHDIAYYFSDRLKDLDRWHDRFYDTKPRVRSREALRQIVYGEELDRAYGTLYAHVVETICLQFGTSFQPGFMRAPVTELDKLLKRRKCPVEVSDLVFRGSPIPIPSDDICVGYWDPQQVQDARSFLSGLKLPRASELIREFVGWINKCLERAAGKNGNGLVGFVY